jgi:hypothetical protein
MMKSKGKNYAFFGATIRLRNAVSHSFLGIERRTSAGLVERIASLCTLKTRSLIGEELTKSR